MKQITDRWAHVNGELVSEDDASVSVSDRGFMYGDAAFETLRVYGGTPFRWDAHATRLAQTAQLLGFDGQIPSAENLRKRVTETLVANELTDAYVRLSVTRGVQPGKLTPDEQVNPTVVVIVKALPRGGIEGSRVWDEPAAIEIADTRRIPSEAVPARAKTHNYLNGILARLELRETDADEALLRSTDGFLTEGATSNLFFLKDGVLMTPTTELPLLPGVTRAVVCECAHELDIPVETGRYTPAVLKQADAVFLTNSTWEIRPVTRVGERSLSVGDITKTLQNQFDERVERLYESTGF